MNKIAKTIAYVFLSNVLAAALGYLFTLIIARKLPVDSFGRISLIISYIYICATIADFGMTITVVTLSNKCEGRDKWSVLAYFNRLFLKLFVVFLPLILLLIGGIGITEGFTSLEFATLFISYVSFLFFRYMQSVQQADGKWLVYNVGNVLNNVLKISTLAVPLLLFFTVVQSDILWSYLVYSAILLVVSVVWMYRFGVKNCFRDDDALNYCIRKHLCSIGISNIIVVLIMRLDLLFISYYLDAQAVGIYSAANSLALIIPLFTNSLMNVLLKYIPDAKWEYLKQLKHFQKKYAVYVLLLIVMLCLLSSHLVRFIYGERYQDSSMIFAILGIIYLLSVLFTPLEAFFYTEYPRYVLCMRVIQLLILLIGLIFFIERWGLYAVAISVFFSKIVNWISLMFRTNKILHVVYPSSDLKEV